MYKEKFLSIRRQLPPPTGTPIHTGIKNYFIIAPHPDGSIGIAPAFTPRPEGLTDPEGSRGIAPAFTPRPEGITDPQGSRALEKTSLSFWAKYEYLILGGLALITIIIMIIMFKKFD